MNLCWCDLGHESVGARGTCTPLDISGKFSLWQFHISTESKTYLNIYFLKDMFTNCLEIVKGIKLMTCFLTHAITEYISLKPESRPHLENQKNKTKMCLPEFEASNTFKGNGCQCLLLC